MKSLNRDKLPVRVRLLAWFNIGVQATFPLAAAFTPSVAGAGSDGRFLQDAAQTQLQTRIYTLGPGETVASVAASYNMTPAALKRLNQLRTFARGFDNLQPGDELDVPLAPLPPVTWQADLPPAAADGDAQAQAVAGVASRAGSFLASGANGDAAASMARGMASGAAGNEVEQWLSRFGTARVKLDVDERLSLKNSQLDMLVPLYDRESDLLFTQGSLHRTDDRTQMNLGAGWRHFTDAQMTGANLFYDRDLSRGHARLGLGGEYWRDFLKLGANGYFRLTDWRDSPDVTDYEERPANGWDLRAQAWLPALPQLGGSLTFEQYYGNEVGLFGKDSRQRNPHAVTAGVNYTPFPLLTLSAEHRQGKQGQNDARFGVDLTWQPGVPWQQQVSPDAVAALRSLAGSRHDLVERNNNIVLEYRKKEVIRLKTAGLVTGYAGEQKSLGVSVNSKYGLKHIDWDAGALTAAGGSIVQSGSDWTVTLPAWQAAGVNSYTVSGVAVDAKGNRSERSTTQVTVQAPLISAENSTFTPAQSTLPADGNSTQVLTLTLKDAQGAPVSVPADDVQFTTTQMNGAILSSPRLKEQGVWEVTVTAGPRAATLTVTPQVAGVTLSPAVVIMEDTLPDAGQSAFTATPDSIGADGVMTSALSLTLKNSAGELLTGQADRLSLAVTQDAAAARSLTGISIGDISEAEPGIYTATLSGTAEGRFRITPQFDKNALNGLGATVTLTSVRPEVSSLKLAGKLEAGQTLTATYAFAANGGNTQDKSTYAWGYEGATGAAVAGGQTVTASGQVPGRAITSEDIGKVMELSVMAKNGADVKGNTLTVKSSEAGNGTEGGNEGGTVIDPSAEPQVSGLKLAGKLEAGQTLTATYAFAANGGNTQDKSTYAWGYEGATGAAVAGGQTVTASGQVPGRAITSEDIGKVMELSVQARNGADVKGNTLTVKSSEAGNGTEGGNEGGTVIDPSAEPQVSGLKMSGTLEAGQTLTATYAFAANGGNAQDKSTYAWGYESTTGAAVAGGQTVTASGQVPGRALTTADVGKVMELSVMARNGADVKGNTLTVKSSEAGNGTEGGNEGGTVIDPSAEPQVSGLKMSGTLEAGQTLTATYAFAANGGNAQDKSTYAWGYESTTGAAVAGGQTVTASGQVPGRALTTADVGKVMELSVMARNGADVKGNTATVTTAESGNGTEGGNEGGTVIDPSAEPQVSGLKMSGTLEAGQTLTATYAFAANGGNAQDKSTYAWGYESTTGAAVAGGQTVTASGQVPGRALTTADVGKVMELSVMARNGADVKGNTLTVKSSEAGNGTEGGNEGGTVIDPSAEPQVSGLKMSGTLEAGQTLTATYAFAANGGNAQDKSTYAWGYESTTGAAVAGGQTVTASGQVPGRALTTADVGKVMELSVMARNGADVKGNTATVTTAESGNGTEGGNEGGTVIDPSAEPQVSGLKMSGTLEAGQTLMATYAFAANGGNAQDKSTYAWGYEGTTGAAVADGQTVTASGQVPGRALTSADVGKVMELSVMARNGADVKGNTATVTTAESGNGTEGGNEGGTVIDPSAEPQVSGLKMSGTLEAGQTLTATYAFAANGGNAQDKSTYAWGYEGATGAAVAGGQSVTASGQVPGRALTSADVGKVMELSVMAKNGADVKGNTATVTTAESGNGTEGGNEGGTVIDPAAEPVISSLKLSGNLGVGFELTGTYEFNPNGGNAQDKSAYAWGWKGQTASTSEMDGIVTTSGAVPGRALTEQDAGKVMELTVQAANGADVKGNRLTIDSSEPDNGSAGNNEEGTVVDPTAGPVVSNLKLAGKLNVGQTLTGTYDFSTSNGFAGDDSTYVWGHQGTTATEVAEGAAVENSGKVPGRVLTADDTGKVMELSVMARNWSGITGNIETVTTAETGNGTEGGNEGGTVIDPAAEPQVSDLKLAGKLEAGQTLTATYTFAANGGNSADKSTYLWGYEGATGTAVTTGESVVTSGHVPGRYLTSADVGKVMELSVMAKNGAGTAGNTETVTSTGAITVGSPVPANSGIKTDAASYMVGDDLKVTVTLKDTFGNPVTGQQALLTVTSVTVPNAVLKEGSGWTDNEDGTYTATYTAETASMENTAWLMLSGWSSSRVSGSYAINDIPEVKNVTVYSHTFAKDAGFPTTGFTGATFTLNLSNGSASDYNWASSANWVSVDNGQVTLISTGTPDTVTITGSPKTGGRPALKYTFAISRWFIPITVVSQVKYDSAEPYCSAQGNYRLPTVDEMSGEYNNTTIKRGMGSVMGEWGSLTSSGKPSEWRIPWQNVWTSDVRDEDSQYIQNLGGYGGWAKKVEFMGVVCVRDL